VARKSLKEALTMVTPGNNIGDTGWALKTYVEYLYSSKM